MVVANVPAAQTPAERRAALRCVDADIHQDLPSFEELRPFLAREWHDWLDHGGPAFAARGVAHVGSGRMEDAVNEEDNLCAGDPDWVVKQLVEKYRVDVGILTGSGQMFGPHLQRNPRLMTALCRAYNDWTLEKWVRPYPYFKGSILVNPAFPEAAAAEVRRLGDDPGMVQVMLFSHGQHGHGQEQYWPIYRAAVDHGLPIGVHIANDIGNSNPQTPVGWYTSFVEHHTDHTQTCMANFVSLLTEGVFEQFPTLKYLSIEGGICWAAYVMGRLDRIYPALKAEVPYLKRLPSEYLLEHCRFSTQPIEEPADPADLMTMLEILHADRTLLFATDYPHWDFDNPMTALNSFPAALKRRVMVENALDFYGDRLLAASA